MGKSDNQPDLVEFVRLKRPRINTQQSKSQMNLMFFVPTWAEENEHFMLGVNFHILDFYHVFQNEKQSQHKGIQYSTAP